MDRQLLEVAMAIRMTSSDAGPSGAGHACSLVAIDDSADAVSLSRATRALEARVPRDGVMVLEAGADGAAAAAGVRAFLARHGAAPSVVALPGHALFPRADTPTALSALRGRLAGVVPEPSTATAETRMRGCVAIVTGAAQGFGRGIAEQLVRHGAAVVIADVNDALGEATARELCAACGAGCAVFAHVDITDLASVESGIQRAIAGYGGIDLFVANAGILKAGSLADMDAASFDLVTRVNYTGYFTCAKAVAPWMRLQHRLNPRHFMDIVQINSKSGLEGSKNNSAYAGSKFGTIGLTQSFALELVGDNIKVNSICPGNYFDGPLWSDPERGLFVQYLRAGKVPGAKTIDDIRAFYMGKVPMNRGCTPEDVAIAILYLRDQKYETGQALPVTGGQVMLN